MVCIWCKNEITTPAEEHGIPEGLGCPPELIRTDIACRSCNNGLGVIDQALLRQFEGFTVMFGIPRKGGRPPTIDGWRAIASEHRASGPHIHINAGPGVVEARGKRLYPAAQSNGIHDVWMDHDAGTLGYKQVFGDDPRFIPALYKIGLNLVAVHFGSEVAADESYDHIRALVLGNPTAPDMSALMSTSVGGPFTSASGPIAKPGRPYPMFQIQILGVPGHRTERDLYLFAKRYRSPIGGVSQHLAESHGYAVARDNGHSTKLLENHIFPILARLVLRCLHPGGASRPPTRSQFDADRRHPAFPVRPRPYFPRRLRGAGRGFRVQSHLFAGRVRGAADLEPAGDARRLCRPRAGGARRAVAGARAAPGLR